MRSALTLLEVVVAIAIIGLLMSLIAPAVQQAREAARRTQCVNHLHQIGVALHQHESVHGRLPMAGSYTVDLLPYLGEQPLHRAFLNEASHGSANFDAVLGDARPDIFVCPSDPTDDIYGTNYAGNYSSGYQTWGSNGLFRYHSARSVRLAEVRDGLSQTAAVSEILRTDGTRHRLRAIWALHPRYQQPDQLDLFADYCEQLPPDPTTFGYRGFNFSRGRPWYLHLPSLCYNHTLPPNRPNCQNGGLALGSFPSGSFHPGGAHTLYGDGHVAFTSQSIDRAVWRDLGSRAQGLVDFSQ